MKRIIIIMLVSVSMLANSQTAPVESGWLKQDKILHVSCSIALTSLCITLANDLRIKDREIVGFSTALAIGIGKEYAIDGYPDVKDLTADIVGCVAGVYANRLFHRWETKKYFKKSLANK